jgi:hypothetical protein
MLEGGDRADMSLHGCTADNSDCNGVGQARLEFVAGPDLNDPAGVHLAAILGHVVVTTIWFSVGRTPFRFAPHMYI